MKLGTLACEGGKYQYRVIGPRPGTTQREHRVPGGRFVTKEEALAHAQAFLDRPDPWEGHPLKIQPAKRKLAPIEPKVWHVDDSLRDQIRRFQCFVTQNVKTEEEVTLSGYIPSRTGIVSSKEVNGILVRDTQVTVAEAKFAALDKKPLSENMCEQSRSLLEARQAARHNLVRLRTDNTIKKEAICQLLRTLQSKLLCVGVHQEQAYKRKWSFDRTLQLQTDVLADLVNDIATTAEEVQVADATFSEWDGNNDSKSGKLSTRASILFERRQGARLKQARLWAESRRWQKVNQDVFQRIEEHLLDTTAREQQTMSARCSETDTKAGH